MKTQIRDSVFETNSSSSHSVTIDQTELVDLSIHKDILRDGVIRVRLDDEGYGWEWKRYRRPENKIAYMLLQFSGGHLPSGISDLDPDADHSDVFREDVRVAWFLSTIEEATGCRVEITRSERDADWGYSIDHQSVGRGIDEFESENDILRLVFGANSYIETGNDNSNPPEIIESDGNGSEQYFEPLLVSGMPDGVQFRLLELDGEGWSKNFEIRTLLEGCISTPDVNWDFRQQVRDLIREGEVVIAGFSISVPYKEDAPDSHFQAFARRTAFDKWMDLFKEAKSLRLIRDFEVSAFRKPYVERADGRFGGNIRDWDYAAQAEVELLACATDNTVESLHELFGRADEYSPSKKGLTS
ncbi:hypothetical protein G6L37_00845 [Agrobacterium rubi]|nr:hypothetical protein [Agrobacterium rubi]NTF23938.1 hypothetical protein [Agrobacterium rubi]